MTVDLVPHNALHTRFDGRETKTHQDYTMDRQYKLGHQNQLD